MTTELGPWDPMPVDEVTDLLRDVDCPWWIAGGWAIWRYRRDGRIERPVAELDGGACNGTPRVLSPEVQLLQKSKSPRDKDEADFLAVRNLLRPDQREWLARALALTSPDHPWRPALTQQASKFCRWSLVEWGSWTAG